MPDPSSSRLFSIIECSDLMADACVCDDAGNLVFLSVWARDTGVQQFLARLTLGADEHGLDRFDLVCEEPGDESDPLTVLVGNAGRLEKRATRAFRRTLFGSLVHLWLFDRGCVKPDKSNSTALALLPREHPNRVDRLWHLVQDTCPLPLLDHWRDIVMDLLIERSMLTRLPTAIGPLEGHRLAIDVPVLTTALGDLIRAGILGASQDNQVLCEPLRRAA
ncbi:hypothetical protein BG46_17155 [Brucella anthropi]|uniref:hypothetical protein n=1 Tax=Brucella anthropi TaxID=529 RepID=UPI00044B546F|nr:hypothetical protein [Brucella anthropi]EXL06480.1 hypothetical protein BG46_17155 [Brucella anthropi]